MQSPATKTLVKSEQKTPRARVTVVLCCYSHENYFLPAAQSILAQTSPVEFVILNNGANESYTALIERYAERNDLKVVDVHPNTYGVAIRDKVLPFIATEFVAILHDDDVYEREKIERSLAALDESGVDFVVTNSVYIDERGHRWSGKNEAVNHEDFTGKETRGRLLADMIITPGRVMHFSTLLMRSDLAKKNVLGDPFWPRISDGLFWGDLFLDEMVRFQILTEPLSRIRIHGANDRLYDKFEHYQKHKQFYLLAVSEMEFIQRVLRRGSRQMVLDFVKSFAGIETGDDLVETLTLAAVVLDQNASKYWISKQYMITLLFHEAFALAPQRACALLEELSGKDPNRFMDDGYQRMAETMFEFIGVPGPASLPAPDNQHAAVSVSTRPLAIHDKARKDFAEADVSARWIWRHPRKAIARSFHKLARVIGGQKLSKAQ